MLQIEKVLYSYKLLSRFPEWNITSIILFLTTSLSNVLIFMGMKIMITEHKNNQKIPVLFDISMY